MSEFSEDKIKSIVFSLDVDKASGPLCFFQRYWNLLEDDLLAVLEDFHNSNLDLSRLNFTNMTLISKKDGSS